MSGTEPLSVRAVRAWCRFYTSGLERSAGERRRLELESDMWEHLHDPTESDAARALIGRFIRGIPADVRWRYRTLLDSRGARQRSEEMNTSASRNWWAPLTAVFGAVLLTMGVFALMIGGSSDGSAVAPIVAAVAGFLSGGLVLGGLSRRRHDVVAGSRLIVAGSAITLLGGIELIPFGIAVLISGLWTGNLRLSETDDAPDLRPSRAVQNEMTRHWYLWLGGAAVCFAVGFLALLLDDPDDLSSLAWATWILSWLLGAVVGGIGMILAGLRVVVRHRTRPV